MSTSTRGRGSPASRGGGGVGVGGGGRGESRGRGGRGGYQRGGGRGSSEGGGRGGYQRGGGRGGEGGRGSGSSRGGDREPLKKENILDLGQYMDRAIYVKFSGGREVSGILKGFDPLLNMVLDDAQEKMRNAEGEVKERSLGLAVIRGTHITTLFPVQGSESISNPYLAAATEEDNAGNAGNAGNAAKAPPKVTPAYQYKPKPEEDSD